MTRAEHSILELNNLLLREIYLLTQVTLRSERGDNGLIISLVPKVL